jgi:hypothetical protein
MNRALPARDRSHRNSDTLGPYRSGRVVSGARGLVGGIAGDRRQAKTDALNVSQHGGFERGRTKSALRATLAPLETLCATSVRMEGIVGQCC